MQTPRSNADVAARRLSQATKVAALLAKRQYDVDSPYMLALTQSMVRGLLACGFTRDFADEEAGSLQSLAGDALRAQP